MENLKNRVDRRLLNNKKNYLKWTSKPSYVAQKIFDNDLVAIHKIKTTLTLNKPAYVRMRVLELNEVLTYMNSIMIILKTNMATYQDYSSQILTA